MIRCLSKRVMLLIAGLVFMIPLLGKPLMAKIDVENSGGWRPHRAGAVKHRPNVVTMDDDGAPCMDAGDSFAGQ